MRPISLFNNLYTGVNVPVSLFRCSQPPLGYKGLRSESDEGACLRKSEKSNC